MVDKRHFRRLRRGSQLAPFKILERFYRRLVEHQETHRGVVAGDADYASVKILRGPDENGWGSDDPGLHLPLCDRLDGGGRAKAAGYLHIQSARFPIATIPRNESEELRPLWQPRQSHLDVGCTLGDRGCWKFETRQRRCGSGQRLPSRYSRGAVRVHHTLHLVSVHPRIFQRASCVCLTASRCDKIPGSSRICALRTNGSSCPFREKLERTLATIGCWRTQA